MVAGIVGVLVSIAIKDRIKLLVAKPILRARNLCNTDFYAERFMFSEEYCQLVHRGEDPSTLLRYEQVPSLALSLRDDEPLLLKVREVLVDGPQSHLFTHALPEFVAIRLASGDILEEVLLGG